MKLSFKEGWDDTMSMVMEVGEEEREVEVESKGLFMRATS
jgi:hypothetical protein